MKKNIALLCIIIFISISNIQTANAQSWSLTGNSGTKVATNFIGTIDNKALVFRTNNIERMRLSKDGKLGLGIATPQAKLHVDGGDFLNLSTAGCFQIGSPAAANLGMDYNKIQSRNNGSASRLYLNYFGGDIWMGAHNADPTPAIYVDADGRVGIGNSTLTSGYALTVNASSTVPGSIFSSNDGNGDGIDAESFYGNGVFGYSTNGYGVYAYADNNNGLYAVTNNNTNYYAGFFVGDVYSSTGVYAGSDQKLKQNINDFSSAMDIINQLHPKLYNYRHDGNYKLMNFPQGNHYGLIAQDVEKILPNLVKNSKFKIPRKPTATEQQAAKPETIDYKALNYTELIPIMIKGMQEQQQRIEQLEKIIEKLSGNQLSAISSQLTDNSQCQRIYNELSNASLKQNAPNPFTQNTIINCNVPSSAKQAQLMIYNQNGSKIKSFDLTNGINNITIGAGTLSSGQYVYSLFIDEKKIDSKKMILTK